MTTRREQLVATASALFAERGFHGVSVHDIGEACGISGPALYKHFSGKLDLLEESLVSISDRLLSEGHRRVEAADGTEAALDALIDWHVDFALSHPDLIIIQEREWATLGPQAREKVRVTQLAYIDLWAEVVRSLRPGLDSPTARAMLRATFGLINSTPHRGRGISEDRLRDLLARMARAALLA